MTILTGTQFRGRMLTLVLIGLCIAAITETVVGQSTAPATSRNVKTFGAVCNGTHDDTSAIQAALAATRIQTPTEGKTPVRVIVPDNCVSGPLVIGSEQWVEFEEGATLHALPGSFPGKVTPFFAISGQHNVTIRGNHATLVMNPQEFTDGEWRAGVFIYQSKNVFVDNLKVIGAGGDGFTVGGVPAPENVTLVNVAADRCIRNGISIITGRNITVRHATLTNTYPNGLGAGNNGPWAGLDIEPNGERGEALENINVEDVNTSGNGSAGVLFSIHHFFDAVSVTISGLHSDHDGRHDHKVGLYNGGILFDSGGVLPDHPLPGQILIEGSTIESPNGSGVLWRDWSANEPKIILRNTTIHKPGAQTTNMNRCGLYYNTTDRAFGARYTPGLQLNVEVDGLVVNDDAGRLVRAVWFEGDSAHPLKADVKGVNVGGSTRPVAEPRLKMQ